VVRNEGEPDVVQISGGEPTVHPDFFAIFDRAKKARFGT
jgi:tetraether lipid synthase